MIIIVNAFAENESKISNNYIKTNLIWTKEGRTLTYACFDDDYWIVYIQLPSAILLLFLNRAA